MINKFLSVIVLILFPIVVISFNHDDKTNFILENSDDVEVLEDTSKKVSNEILVKILTNNKIETLNLEDYIVGVVAAEMPASFSKEALKAQAVASRSYALYRKTHSNLEYDLTDNTSTQSYITVEQMHQKWGDTFDKYYNRIKTAVLETQGEIATYNNEIIEALYFSMSAGQTQDVQAVFQTKLDYLKSTESIYDNDNIKNFKAIKTISIDDFKKSLSVSCNPINYEILSYENSGYVSKIRVCDKVFNGNTFRKLLGLRSANFQIDIGEEVIITTFGYGHGVGMSQYGANGYAENGYDYKDILNHYYSNIEITNINNV